MAVYTTEIASDRITSDNPIHQRLLEAYYLSRDYLKGDLLEVGCGEGRGIAVLLPHCDSYTGIDKIEEVINSLRAQYPDQTFISGNIPPLSMFESASFDSIVSFQVIEHIRDDHAYLQELYRVLKPGGVALLTTPNRKMSLSRNPWHIREYTAAELTSLAKKYFPEVEMKGITGNDKVMRYYELNKASVRKFTRFDIFNLQYRLPAPILRIPYEFFNRLNRNKLKETDDALTLSIQHDDYILTEDAGSALDLFCILKR
ncbi:class I SAM-dependent methyltransferase [Fulvivirga sedimenti]|uniref:Methyltransferase domain-containing protein n=1 Tax=Fulvivirga sedimenti TaxID=2879465 RepID=A0A9X1HX81_9BACT|nr:class I SAM-dependent methyltransferase [Fulvivirga sedimenti]MCA6078119.1 methyltransferase domain-containing protein [Fulvivirga sedimenti]